MLSNDSDVRQIAEDIFNGKEFNPSVNPISQWLDVLWQKFLDQIDRLLEPVFGYQPSPSTVEAVGYLIGLALIMLVILGVLKKAGRVTVSKIDRHLLASDQAVPNWLQQAYEEAGQGSYWSACAFLFRAVLAKLPEQGYEAPFQVCSTRGILGELETMHYPYLEEFRRFCARFNYLFYGVNSVDEEMWLSFLEQGQGLLTKGGNHEK